MICPDCHHDNIEGVDVCAWCGHSLTAFDPHSTEVEQFLTTHTIEELNPKDAVTVDVDATVAEAVAVLVKQRFGCVLVVRDGEFIALLTERDVLNKATENAEGLQQRVGDLATHRVQTVTREDSIAYALHAMDLGGYRHLPVVDGDRPVGIVSVRDILRYMKSQFAELQPD